MLKTKKLDTKNSQIKHCPCSKYEDIQTRFVQFTSTKFAQVTKNWNWSLLISQPLKISNINTGHKFKMVWNRRHNLQARIVQFTDQKKTAKKVTKNWNWPFLISQLLKISNINTGHKSKMVWNKRHNLQTRIVQFADQKKVWIGTNSTNRTFDK